MRVRVGVRVRVRFRVRVRVRVRFRGAQRAARADDDQLALGAAEGHVEAPPVGEQRADAAVAVAAHEAEHDARVVSPLALVHGDDLHLVHCARAAGRAAARAVYSAGCAGSCRGVASAHLVRVRVRVRLRVRVRVRVRARVRSPAPTAAARCSRTLRSCAR